jgi:hypothetical protein
MLIQTTFSPQLIAGVPVDPSTQKLFCNLWLGLLYDFAENGVVVMPKHHITRGDYLSALSMWPSKYKKRAQELVVMLYRRRRFISSQVADAPTATCSDTFCQAFIGVSILNTEAFYLAEEKCLDCMNTKALAHRRLEALEYFVSELSRHRRDCLAYVLGDGQWQQRDFEYKILRPVFTTATHIKIFDRWIGRSAFDRRKRKVQFNPNYKKTLEWVIEVFRDVGGVSRAGSFEIYCGVQGNVVDAAQRDQLRTEMERFESEILVAAGISVKVFLKEESPNACCLHGRYLVTDQATVLIDRGFDLLWDDNRMRADGLTPGVDSRPVRDVAVMLCNNCDSIETQTRTLPEL